MNKVILSGNLCKDNEKAITQSGVSVLRNTIAIKRDYKNANGEYETDFIQIVVWKQQADYLAQYASKGDLVELVGRWETRKFQDSQGQTREVNECIVENVKILQNRANGQTKAKGSQELVEDEDSDGVYYE